MEYDEPAKAQAVMHVRNPWKKVPEYIEMLATICKYDDKRWYVTGLRQTFRELYTEFCSNRSCIFERVYPSVKDIIRQIQDFGPYKYGRAIGPMPKLDESSTLPWPSEEPWDQTAFNLDLAAALSDPERSLSLWRNYEDEALRRLVAANRTITISWPAVLEGMITLSRECGWGSWDNRPQPVYTIDSLRHRAGFLGIY